MDWVRERRTELVRFAVVGAVAFIVDIGLFNVLHYGPRPILGDKIVTAKVVAAIVATVVSWIGNRLWTFRAKRTHRPGDELVVFAFINVVALLIPVLTVAFTAYVLGTKEAVPANIAAVVGIGIGTIARYVGYRRYVFTDADVLRARLVRIACSAPDRILLVLVALAASCAAAVSLGMFRPWVVLPLAFLGSYVLSRMLPTRPPSATASQGAAWLLFGVAAWFLVNLPFVAEYLIVRRDPGFLTLTGMWLTDHPTTDIPADGAVEAASASVRARADQGEAWTLRGDSIQPQGAKLLPALLAVGGWALKTPGVLTANLAIGAVCLVAVYVLAREVLSPFGALVPVVGVGLSLSHLWFSRAAYTEPLTLLLLFAAIAWAIRGIREARAAPVLASALASGLIVFVRIDGAAYAAGVLIGVGVALAGSREGGLKRTGSLLAGFAAFQGILVASGYASLSRWGAAYLRRLSDEAGALGLGYAIVAGIVLLAGLALLTAAALRSKSPDPPRPDSPSEKRRLIPRLAAGSVVLAFAILASRPLWTTAHGKSRVPDYIEYLQAKAGVPVDPTRTYAESTVTWMSHYLTWPLLALGVGGFAWAAWRWAAGDRAWAVFLAGLLTPTALYLVRPSIVPDQAWAIRRLYPSGVTGLIVAAAFAWAAAARVLHRKLRPERAATASTVLAAVVALCPMLAWVTYAPGVAFSPLLPSSALYLPEQWGARAMVDTLCDYVDGRPVVLVGSQTLLGTVRVSCDVPVVLVQGQISQTDLAGVTSAWDDAVVLTENPANVPWDSEPLSPTFESRVRYATGALTSLPVEVSVDDFAWYVGEVGSDGGVRPVFGHGES